MKSYNSNLLKYIAVIASVSIVTSFGFAVSAEPEDIPTESQEIVSSELPDVSSDESVVSEDTNTSEELNTSEESDIDDVSSDNNYQENSQTEYNNSNQESNISNYNESDTESNNDYYTSKTESTSSHSLIQGDSSEMNTSEMNDDDWYFNINESMAGENNLTDFSEIKDSQKSEEKNEKDDSQWILYTGIALIACALAAIAFVITTYVMFKKKNVSEAASDDNTKSNRNLKHKNKLPKNNNKK